MVMKIGMLSIVTRKITFIFEAQMPLNNNYMSFDARVICMKFSSQSLLKANICEYLNKFLNIN
jgi:hypothetical protein